MYVILLPPSYLAVHVIVFSPVAPHVILPFTLPCGLSLILAAVLKIASNPNCTLAERERFDVCLRELIKSCDYDLCNPPEDAASMQPIIIQ